VKAFDLGRVVITAAASEWMESRPGRADAVSSCLSRHLRGDWGGVSDADAAANNAAISDGERLLSSYEVDGRGLWVITEADRSVTTVLFPEDY
jgi:hypothetical protein